jgi:hypothetical protein
MAREVSMRIIPVVLSLNNYIGIDEEMKVEEVMKAGSRVYIYKGQHKGLKGTVTHIFKPQASGIVSDQEDESKIEVTLELDINQLEVTVKKNRVVLESKRKELLDKKIIKDEDDQKDSEMSDSDESDKSDKSDISSKHKKRYVFVK